MVLGAMDTLLLGGLLVQMYSSFANALPKPKQDGWYSFFYLFTRGLASGVDSLFEQRFHLRLPDVLPAKLEQPTQSSES